MSGNRQRRLPHPPREPDIDDCCGTGCDPCIFDIYEERLTAWRERCRAIEADDEPHGPEQ